MLLLPQRECWTGTEHPRPSNEARGKIGSVCKSSDHSYRTQLRSCLKLHHSPGCQTVTDFDFKISKVFFISVMRSEKLLRGRNLPFSGRINFCAFHSSEKPFVTSVATSSMQIRWNSCSLSLLKLPIKSFRILLHPCGPNYPAEAYRPLCRGV
jgi:hypothetical protein